MFLAAAPAALALSSFTPMFNNSVLTLYSGTPPATAETGLSGNTVLATYTFAATAFSTVSTSGGFDSQNGSFVSSTASPSNSGTVTFARATLVSTVWAATTAYTVGAIVSKSSNYYACILSGTSASSGPTGTTLAQIDGTTAWSYIGPTSGGTCLAQMTVGTSGTDIILTNTSIQTGTTVTITSLAFQLAVN